MRRFLSAADRRAGYIGRWMYFELRQRSMHPLIVSAILLLTIFLSSLAARRTVELRRQLQDR